MWSLAADIHPRYPRNQRLKSRLSLGYSDLFNRQSAVRLITCPVLRAGFATPVDAVGVP